MREFIKHFKRTSDGGWRCVADVEFIGPEGRIQVSVGSKFMLADHFFGVDLAEWLNEQLNNDRRKDGRRTNYSDEDTTISYMLRHFAPPDQFEKSGSGPLL